MDLRRVKEYLRVDNEIQDSYIEMLISVADDYMENAIDNYREKMKSALQLSQHRNLLLFHLLSLRHQLQ